MLDRCIIHKQFVSLTTIMCLSTLGSRRTVEYISPICCTVFESGTVFHLSQIVITCKIIIDSTYFVLLTYFQRVNLHCKISELVTCPQKKVEKVNSRLLDEWQNTSFVRLHRFKITAKRYTVIQFIWATR